MMKLQKILPLIYTAFQQLSGQVITNTFVFIIGNKK